MTSVRCMSFVRHTTLLCAAVAFSLCTASAQNTTEPDSSISTGSSATYSSSLADEASMPDLDALPSAPSPSGAAAAAGQYDNKSRGGGGGVISHLTYEVGGGFNAPTSDSSRDITWGWNFTLGGGYRFNRNFATLIEYQFIHSKLPGQLIAQAGATGGYAHIWSFTVAPEFDINPQSAVEFYAIGGGGFYRKVTSFTNPQAAVFCYYFYCGIGVQNVVVGHFSSNQGGWNIGGGIAHRFRGWNGDGRMKVFAEARYLEVLSPAVTTQPNGLGTTTVSEDTKIIPVTFGLRW